MVLPLTSDEASLRAMVSQLDGLVFSGGGDVDPVYFGEYQHPGCGTITPLRDQMELPLARLAYEQGRIPVLGICRGFQVLNIALGGDVWQDLPSECPTLAILHRQKQPSRYVSHAVDLVPGSLPALITGETRIMVNSFHHQAVRRPAEPFTVVATAPDQVIEAAQIMDHPFFLGVQWHPERLHRTDEHSRRLFRAFVDACAK